MKKILAVCVALAMLTTLGTLLCFAETETDTTVKYGSTDLALTLIDPFDETQELPGFMNWGNGKMENGHIFMECGGDNLYDIYSMTTDALKANPTVGGHTYIVFAVSNTSDGDIKFCFQPDIKVDGAVNHTYISDDLAAEHPIKLLAADGTVTDAKFSKELSAGRDVIYIPYEFEGYVFIPHAVLTIPPAGTEAACPNGKVEYTGFGLHALPDDATYMEFTISAAYACSELPAYTEETDAPTAAPTTPETDPPTQPETNAPTAGAEVTESETGAPTEPKTDAKTDAPAKTGCGATVGLSAAVLITAAAAVVMKKKD